MRIRTKAIVIFLFLSLVPLVSIGLIASKNAEATLKKTLGSNLQVMAHEAIESVNHNLYEAYHNVQSWSELELMQEVIIGDIDGNISSFLMDLVEKYKYFYSIDALNSQGEVVASSSPGMIGRHLSEEVFYRNVINTSRPYIRDAYWDASSGNWLVGFCFPIKAQYEEAKTIGVLYAAWKVDELIKIIQSFTKGEEKYFDHIMLLRKDGLIIYAPQFERESVFKGNLIKEGLNSALFASQGREGYLVEINEHRVRALMGYSASRGYRDFPGLGWSTLVTQDIKAAFAPVGQLKNIIFWAGFTVAALAVVISIFIARKITHPLLRLSSVANNLAQGNFGEKVDYASGDEIGSLVKSFNKMAADLSASIERQKELVAAKAAQEVERKRAAELNKAYRELQEAQDMLIQAEKLNAVGQLASGIAHEVKNPLAIILQGVSYLKDNLSLEGSLSQTLDIMKENVERADKIVCGLVDFSRATKLNLEPISINSVLENSLSLVQHRLKFKAIEIIREMSNNLPKLSVDKVKMEQVFVNIFLNAIDAMPDGGKIFIRSYLAQLERPKNGVGRRDKDDFRLGEKAAMVEIEDTGIGIPKEQQKKIFDPFFTTKGPGKGTGLGLSVTRNIIHMHKGLIEVASREGKGAKFTITLKIRQENGAGTEAL